MASRCFASLHFSKSFSCLQLSFSLYTSCNKLLTVLLLVLANALLQGLSLCSEIDISSFTCPYFFWCTFGVFFMLSHVSFLLLLFLLLCNYLSGQVFSLLLILFSLFLFCLFCCCFDVHSLIFSVFVTLCVCVCVVFVFCF